MRYTAVAVGASVLALGVAMAIDSVEVIQPGTVGVPIVFGKADNEVLSEGLHFVLPFVTQIKTVPVQQLKAEIRADGATNDLQSAVTQVAVNYSVTPSSATDLVRKYGDTQTFYERVIVPIVEETVKASTAKRQARELIQNRQEFKQDLEGIIKERLRNQPVTIQTVNVTDFSFSKAFTDSIEAAQVAKQLEQKAQAEGNAKVAEARAQAESQRLQAASITVQYLELEKLKVQQEMIRKWNGVMPLYQGSGNENFLMQIPSVPNTTKK